MGLGERIDSLLQAKGWSQAELARRVGVKATSIWKLVTGETQATRHLHAIARELGTSPEYLLGETDDPGAVAAERRPALRGADEDHSDDVGIDSLDLSYGMGGTFVDVEPGSMEIEQARFSRAWLRKFTHAPPELLFTTSGVGDSMRPTIEDHDVVIVDRSATLEGELGEKIWAVVFGGVGMIKRLRPMPDGTVKLMSDNQSVRDEIATDNDLHIIGRVVAVVRRH